MRVADQLIGQIRERGPVTVAAFMDLALYDPAFGYYAREPRRSGRAGDFFTSVDVGPLFGELLERQLAEMAEILDAARPDVTQDVSPAPFDLVEAGAGNGRLAADILRAAALRHPAFYDRIRLHLVEQSAVARAAHHATLGEVADSLTSSSDTLPASFEGALVANELLDALPVHQVVMREEGLCEVYVDADGASGRLVVREGAPSTPALAEYLADLEIVLEPGWRCEINLRAVEWVRDAARRMRRGFLVLIDYGHEARELYSAAHADGTLTAYMRHASAADPSPAAPSWLWRPGEQDITAHVDFTSIRAAAEAEGLVTLGLLDQTYFLLSLMGGRVDFPAAEKSSQPHFVRALKTLIMPGGLGSTMKVLILGKGVGAPSLLGCSCRVRMT